MSIVAKLLYGDAQATERRMSFDDLKDVLMGPATAAGRSVSPEGALVQTTVFACVRLISESVGMLPLILYKRLDRGKERASNHPLYTLLHDLPNPELTALELFENIAGYLCLWGNAYCEIEYDGAGRRRALWPLRPDKMSVYVTEQNERYYVYEEADGSFTPLPRYKVWHIRGWGTDAWMGKSPIALAREAIGLALATEEFGARWFSNGSRPGGFLKRPAGSPRLSDDRLKALREQVQAFYGGLTQAHRIGVLDDGYEWQQVGIPPEEAQFLETRKYQKSEICSIFRVPPHMIADVERSTSWGTGIEQQGIGFVTFTLLPYLTRITQSISRDLLSANERNTYFAEHLTAALVRGDLKGRYDAYNVGRNGGWLSVNDIRELENMNPIKNGDDYLQPLNMVPLGTEPEPQAEPQTGGNDDETQPDN